MALSSSPIPLPQREYDVFLSFSGLDSRKTIISHLRVALKRNGFRTFRDDKNLDRGKSIAPGLLKAIENSSMSLVVFSKNYFASTWCLGELEKIMECSKNLQYIVLPIFYEIEPSDIRKLKGNIAETLAKHKEEVPKMENWRATLTEVASLTGFVSNNYRDEASLVEDIVKVVQGKLNSSIHLNVATHPVGIMPRLQELLKLLCLESSDDVRIIAIWGVGGVGKTTIAKAAYNCIHSKFEGCSFVANVRETWEQSKEDLLALQKQILVDIMENENYNIGNSHVGIEFIKRKAFYGRKVLLVLDDVDRVEQLNALAINPRFFHRGSRIIVTTRNISSLNSLESVLSIYKPEQLNKDESLQLFNLSAFNEHNPPEGFMELSNTVVDYAGGIPLVLEVLGSFLNGKDHQSEWRSAIIKLKKIPHNDIQRKLRISFDSLDTEEKKLFLDIACFFAGKSKNFTIQVLQDCKIFPKIGFRRLEELCLLKYHRKDECNYCPKYKDVIVMHDILKQMGREIVRQESVDYPEKRSRLWNCKDALEVLKNCKGTEAVEGLFLFSPKKKDIQVNAKAFQKMKRLRVLHLDHVLLSAGYEHLSRDLVWLCWHHFSLSVLPSQLYLENLVALDLSYSNIKQVWRVPKVLSKLKFLVLSNCHNLITTPNFSGLSNLEVLLLSNCIRLQEVDKSIGHLQKLLVLDLRNCESLRKLPSEIANLKSLEQLIISQYQDQYQTLTKKSIGSLGSSLNYVQGLRCLKILHVEDCSLIQLPEEIGNMISLTRLSIFGSKFGCLPKSICNLTKLEILMIASPRLSNLPSEVGRLNQLKTLYIGGNNFSSLPESIGDLTHLRHFHLAHCERLQSLPKLSGSRSPKSAVIVYNCPSLESISLESIMNYELLSCYRCPKLVEKYSTHKIGTSFLNYKGAISFRICHSGGMFPYWLQYETTNSYYALKVPPLGVGNKHFIRWIFYVVHTIKDLNHLSWYMDYKFHNKTKDVYIDCRYLVARAKIGILVGDQTIFDYCSFHVKELDLEEGDEIEISWNYGNVVLKKWGIHVSYYTLDDYH
ncbi:disease resistance protein RPV1-like isoform X2 [Diospyros lotus]|nr:disease resistance protein RPV1-like isoform X2 [Diospyros lotus]XP_052170597.1 disease resistance protein RPV1-like isoform X2 [Diospyros lotus]XP_052170598.1 disease resistance protein RPV1-like isoform X2 [Diospyros lotus]